MIEFTLGLVTQPVAQATPTTALVTMCQHFAWLSGQRQGFGFAHRFSTIGPPGRRTGSACGWAAKCSTHSRLMSFPRAAEPSEIHMNVGVAAILLLLGEHGGLPCQPAAGPTILASLAGAGNSQTVTNGEKHHIDAGVSVDGDIEGADRLGCGIMVGAIDRALPQRVVDQNQPAGMDEVDASFVIGEQVLLVGINEGHVECAAPALGKHAVER
jgi:hypothetical protein